MKFATVFHEPETIQVWGMWKPGQEFHKQFVKPNCDALYCWYLTKLYGDTAQTMYLLANYKVFEGDTLTATKRLAPTVSRTNEDFSNMYCSLTTNGDVFNLLVQHVDGIFCQAVVNCYGQHGTNHISAYHRPPCQLIQRQV